MAVADASRRLFDRLKSWHVLLVFSALLCVIYAFGSFTFDYFAGAATAEFGAWDRRGR